MNSDLARMTGALIIMLADRPGMEVDFVADSPDDQPRLEVQFDVLPGRYRLTIEEIPH